MLSIISLLVVLTLSILVTRIATVALTYTGLSRQSARFQARSAFTGVGFTTSESEKVVNHPMRRKILMLLMLFGNAGVITAVSSLILSFININEEESNAVYLQIVLLITGLVVLWTVANSHWVDNRLSNLIAKGLKKYTKIYAHDFPKLLHLAGEYQINELHIGENHWLCDKTIADVALRKEGITVLGINRVDGNYFGAPTGDTKIERNDVLIVYGRVSVLEELEEREAGVEGNREHQKKMRDQHKVQQKEKDEERDQ